MNFTNLLEDELNFTETENGAVALKSCNWWWNQW